MRRLAVTATLVAALAAVGASVAGGAGPITKQNGSAPLFADFTSICAVPGYVRYGHCDGDPTRFTNVTGRINVIQAKSGIWNLGLSFSHLQPGALYKLWGNRQGVTPVAGAVSGFFPIATATAGADGTARYSYQTTDPTNLGFDLNILWGPDDWGGITIVTSYWSSQWVQVRDANGTLYVPTA
jgi:hypothetical protein